jgi:4-hydroxy-tetrahydrodipicolinate synthase
LAIQNNTKTLLHGTGVALITPFKSNFEVDLQALGNMIDFVIRGGVEYIVTLGTTGETPTLSKEEKIAIIQYTYEKVKERIPVVVGIGGNNTQELINDLQTFPLAKSIAILSASPYYSKPSQQGIYEHYKALAVVSPKPLLLYNVPGRTGRNIAAATTLRLAREVPNIIGIKEASGDMAQCMELLRDRPDNFLIVSGDDGLALPQIACGMDGIISVAANCFPKEFSDMVRLSLKGEFKNAKLVNDTLIAAYEMLFAENNPAGVKAFCTEFGLIENNLRLPITPVSEELHQKIKSYLATLN